MRLRNVVMLSVAVLAGAAVAMEFAARSAAIRAARALAPKANLTYESAGVALDGSVRLDAPRLEIEQGPWRGILQARQANLRGSSRFWLLGQAFTSERGMPNDLSVEVRGLKAISADPASDLPNWVGTPDLALFENQGCGSDALGDKDRAKMGVVPSERIDHFDYHYDPAAKTLDLGMLLESANIATWQGSAEFKGFDAERWSGSGSQQELRLVRAGLSYRDPGYLSRRNQFCSQWLGVSPPQFIDRHVDAVKTFLGSRGINPGADVLALYERLVTRGGSLNLASLPDAGWVPAEIGAYPRQVLLRQLNITARLDDAPPIMLRLAFSDPEVPLYVVKANAPLVPPEVAIAATEPSSPAPAGDAPAAAEPAVESAPAMPREPASAPPDVVEATEPPAQAEAQASPEASGEADKPARVDRTGKVIASAPPPPPNSTLALVWEPGVIERLPPQEKKGPEYEVVTVASLGQRIGRRVQLVTSSGKRVDGEVHALEPGNLVLLIQVGRGSAKLNVPLSNIREARLFPER